MKKKILFLLNILFFHINIIGGETKANGLLNLTTDIIDNIRYNHMATMNNLQEINNFRLTCKTFNNYDLDALLCPTHNQTNHQCPSFALANLKNDYDRCTYILHCLANRENKIKPYEFNNPSEKNLFSMIYNLHSRERGILIQKKHRTLDIELFTPEIKRNYYQYTKENTENLLLTAIKQKKIIRIKQILQSSTQYIKQIFTTIYVSLEDIIDAIMLTFQDITEFQDIIEFLLKNINDTNTTDQHHMWEEIVLQIHQHRIETDTKNKLINFLLSDTFNYLNPYFSADFYIKKNGYLCYCYDLHENFDLLSDRCQKDALFNSNNIEYLLLYICKKKDFALSIKIIKWLISKNVDFRSIGSKELLNAYELQNIDLVKLFLNQGVNYKSLLLKICQENDIKLATWILDNCNKNDKFKYDDNFIYEACLSLNIDIVQLLFDKKMPVDFYKYYQDPNYKSRQTEKLFSSICRRFHWKDNYNDVCCNIIKLFLDNGFDVTEKIIHNKSYIDYIQNDEINKKYLVQFLEHPNVKKYIKNTKELEQSDKKLFSKILFYINNIYSKILPYIDNIFFNTAFPLFALAFLYLKCS